MPGSDVSHALNASVSKFLRDGAMVLAICVFLTSAAALLGYLIRDPWLISLSPRLQGMSELTACSLLLLACAALLEQWRGGRIVPFACWLCIALGTLMTGSYAVWRRDAIDPLITSVMFPAATPIAGKTSIATAICIIMTAAALLLSHSKRWLASNLCAAATMTVSSVAVLGYFYGVGDLYDLGPFHTMAFHTAASLFFLSMVVIVQKPEHGWARILASPLAGGGPSRRQMLFILLPPIAGWVLLKLAGLHYLGFAAAMALLVISTVLPLTILILHDGLTRNALDLERLAKLDLQARTQQNLEERLAAQSAELALRAQLERTLSDVEIVGTWEWDSTHNIIIADERCAKLFGVDAASARRGATIELFTAHMLPDDRKRAWRELAEAAASGQPFTSEFTVLLPDGTRHHLLSRGQTPAVRDVWRPRFPGVVIDITDQRIAEQALNESRDRYRLLFESIDAGFCIIEVKFDIAGFAEDYRFIEVNPAFTQQTGLQDVAGKWISALAPANEQYWSDIYGDVARTGQRRRFENRAGALQDRWYDVLAFRIGEPAAHRVAILFNDITSRRCMEDALRSSEQQFRSMAQAMPNHVWTALPSGYLDWLNERVTEYSGLSTAALEGEGWTSLVHPEDLPGAAARWAAALESGAPYETAFRLRRHDGVYRWHIARAIAITGQSDTVTRWIGSNTDIDDQKSAAAALAGINVTLEDQVRARTDELMAAEAALRQSQKMEAVGQLTGGIAHDFNNLLTGISGSLELLESRVAQGRYADLQRYLHAARGASTRAAALTHRLLAFSRRQTLDPKPSDVNRIVASLDELIRRTVGPTIAVETIAAAGLWPTLIDPNQLENAILNLCINARDAMPNGGRLTVETSNKWLDERAAKDHDLVQGQYMALCVSDTGTGMPADVIERAFDPFFTTKPLGEGTGLGLSMVYGFVRQSGGQARIYSEVDKGTLVCLYLPRHFGDIPETERVIDPAEVARATQGEVVLVVDDEPTVRMLVTEVLEELGYAAIEAEDGKSGLRILETKRRIDLLITDVGLPGGMNGRQLADAGIVLRPGLKTLFITGYAENAISGNGLLQPGMHVLTKPFAMETLASRIRSIIAAT